MKVKNDKATATLTDVKNRIGDVFSLVDDFGEVTITSYNKPAYIISKFEPVEEKKKGKTETKPKASVEMSEEVTPEPIAEPQTFTKAEELDIFLAPEPKVEEVELMQLPELPTLPPLPEPEVKAEEQPVNEVTQENRLTTEEAAPTTTPEPVVKQEPVPEPKIEIKPEKVSIDNAQNVTIEVNTEGGKTSNIKVQGQKRTNIQIDDIEEGITAKLDLGDTYEEVPIAPPVTEVLGGIVDPFEQLKRGMQSEQSDATKETPKQPMTHTVEEAVTVLANTTYSDLWNRANVKEKAWVEAARNLF